MFITIKGMFFCVFLSETPINSNKKKKVLQEFLVINGT